MRGHLREHRLTALQYLILQWVISARPTTMAQLARFLGVRPQTVTSIVDSLERRGWIRREGAPSDRRRSMLCLTPAGLRWVQGIRRVQERRIRTAVSRVNPRSLSSAASALRVTSEALRRDGAGSAGPRRLPHRGTTRREWSTGRTGSARRRVRSLTAVGALRSPVATRRGKTRVGRPGTTARRGRARPEGVLEEKGARDRVRPVSPYPTET